MTRYDLPFPQNGGPNCTLVIFRMATSPQRVIRSTSCLVLGKVFTNGESNGTRGISGSIKSRMAVGGRPAVGRYLGQEAKLSIG